MKIDFLIGDNPYGSTAVFAEDFSKALARKGVSTRLFYIGDGNFYKAFYAIMRSPPDLTCSFSDITVGEQESLGSRWQIPHLSMLIDPAIYFQHLRTGDYSILSSCDRDDVLLLGQKAFFLPHGVSSELSGADEKLYDISFFGTCLDPEKRLLSWQEKYSKEIVEILREAARKVLSPKGISCLRALLELGVKEDLPLLHAELDAFITAKDRISLIQAIGTPVHIFGEGPWEKYCPSCIYHGPIPFTKTLEKMGQSKVVLNSSPRFKNGSHERLFLSPVLGAALVSGTNPYIEEIFGALPVTYPCGDYAIGAHLAKKLLGDEKNRMEVVQRAREIVLQDHTWDARAETLIHSLSLLSEKHCGHFESAAFDLAK